MPVAVARMVLRKGLQADHTGALFGEPDVLRFLRGSAGGGGARTPWVTRVDCRNGGRGGK